METPKQQAIKAAYGDMWIYMSSFPQARNIALENEGWVFITQLPSTIDRTLFDFQHRDSICRPKSLSGIENNRGWTRIESEEDLPKDDYFGDLFEVGFLDESGFFHHDRKRCSFKSLKWMYEKKLITHYQLVEKPKPPIF
ncbi:hypothetical protein [Elizabethkingia meningoseptica]|uniref:hypothetical protein n=1 Tax=Elizabethkingia meningoseptica TaxID=238 RepID=UPI001628097F|nr:hypothetical protein [Elizabethkingia meningoseptica]MBG0514072.1 hypothetical protein [Elizabethkingia meningoseptica]